MEIVRTFHVRHYEQLHVQYLEMVLACTQSVLAGLLACHQPFSAWDDPGSYAGFVPSHSYFCTFYNNMIKRHAAEMDQHMAMISAQVLCVDHSFKVCPFWYKGIAICF